MIKVSFTDEYKGKRTITVKMNSFKTYEKFIDEYKYIGGYNRFSSEIYGYINKKESENLPFVPANNKGFEFVYKMLYGESPYSIYTYNTLHK